MGYNRGNGTGKQQNTKKGLVTTMSIGSTIKSLRRKHDITQEHLADLLGLTPAAVSGWECDRNAPDISQLPLLSRIFGVSADVLLGIDLSAQDEKIEAIIEKAATQCTSKEAVEVYRVGLAEYPASYRLMLFLADSLDYDGEPDTYDARIKEKIALYERIRECSNDEYYKNTAEGHLCGLYLRQGKRDQALKIAESVPNLPYPRSELRKMLLEGLDKIHDMHHNIHGTFATLCDDIYFFTKQKVDGKPFFTHEQAITMLEKIPRLHEIFYENGDYLGENWILAWAYTAMAEHYADLGDGVSAVKCLKSAAVHAKEADAYMKGVSNGPYGISDVGDYPPLPIEFRHTSILASPEFGYPTATWWVGREEKDFYSDRFREDISHQRFDFIRDEIADLI